MQWEWNENIEQGLICIGGQGGGRHPLIVRKKLEVGEWWEQASYKIHEDYYTWEWNGVIYMKRKD